MNVSTLQDAESRCLLKARGSYWAAKRQRLLAKGSRFKDEIEPIDRDMIAKAKEQECYLWMLHPNAPHPADLSLFDDMGGCFRAVAEAVSVLRTTVSGKLGQKRLQEAISLAAEVQSALRVAIHKVGGQQDPDQLAVFQWLQSVTSDRKVHVERFMRSDDPADPGSWERLVLKARELNQRVEQERSRREDLNKIRFHQKAILGGKGGPHDWQLVTSKIDSLVSAGLPPNTSILRELVGPLVPQLPGDMDWPEGFQRVREAVEKNEVRIVKGREEAVPSHSSEIAQVARLLEGRSILIIGGEERPDTAEDIKSAFRLSHVEWISTQGHESPAHFEHQIAAPNVAVVLLLIRWTRHGFGRVRQYCRKHGKEFARLPGGCGVNQVANQILGQCGYRLKTQAGLPSN